MKMFHNQCPICFQAMENSAGGKWLTCDTSPTHRIQIKMSFSYLKNERYVDEIYLSANPAGKWRDGWYMWDVAHKILIRHGHRKDDIELPFFEPDLSDHDKLLNKLKLYMVFS